MGSLKSCNSNSSNTWSRKMPEGLDLEISHHPLTMKMVGNLIIALERLKGSKFVLRSCIVMVHSTDELDSAQESHFTMGREHVVSVMDSQQRSLVRVDGCLKLHAMLLQGGSQMQKVTLKMFTYMTLSSQKGLPVVLGIKDTNLYLSCHKGANDIDPPSLDLEVVEDKTSLNRISNQSEMLRFIFYKVKNGVSNSTLMSAFFEDYFISTEEEDNKPVIMSTDASGYHTFYIIQK